MGYYLWKMRTQNRFLRVITQLAIVCSIIGILFVSFGTYDSRFRQDELRDRLKQSQRLEVAGVFHEPKAPLNEVREHCASVTNLVFNLSVRAKAGGSVVNLVMASAEHEKRGIVVSARGTYALLKDETVVLVKEIPCASLDSIDFHRDRATDAELVAESKMSLY